MNVQWHHCHDGGCPYMGEDHGCHDSFCKGPQTSVPKNVYKMPVHVRTVPSGRGPGEETLVGITGLVFIPGILFLIVMNHCS